MADVILMVTNGGPHPADKWAALVSNAVTNLIQVDDLSDSAEAAQARKAKPRFAITLSDALEPIFNDVMDAERNAVNSGTIEARHSSFDVASFVDRAASAVVSTAGEFAGHFEQPDVSAIIRNIIQQNIIDAANIARSWAFDAKGL